VDFLVRDAPDLKLWAVAIQAMLQEALNIETRQRTIQISAWFDDAQSGNFDLTISAIVSTLLDPSDYFHAWYSKDGPQNYSRWQNPAFQALLPQIDRARDDAPRKALIRQAEDILEQAPPLLPIAYQKINDCWYNSSKGSTPPPTSGSMMWCAGTPPGWTSSGSQRQLPFRGNWSLSFAHNGVDRSCADTSGYIIC
jgi:peptide/nickel transport system substrate-binding protein